MKEAPTTHQKAKRRETVPVGGVFDGSTVHRPLRAIRLKCLDCCGESAHEVRMCAIRGCTLWPYRMGHRPSEA